MRTMAKFPACGHCHVLHSSSFITVVFRCTHTACSNVYLEFIPGVKGKKDMKEVRVSKHYELRMIKKLERVCDRNGRGGGYEE